MSAFITKKQSNDMTISLIALKIFEYALFIRIVFK